MTACISAPAASMDESVAIVADSILPAGRALWRRVLLSRRTLRWALFAAVVAIEIALVAPHLSFSTAAFSSISLPLVAAAVVAEALSIMTFSRMRRRLLRAGGVQVGIKQMGVLTLASNAISATAPAGTAVSAAYLYQQLRRKGANSAVVVWTIVAGSVMSGLAFSIITIAGAMLDGDVDFGEIVGAAGVSLLLGAGLVSGLAFASSHPAPLLRTAERFGRRVPARFGGSRGTDGNVLHERAEQILGQLTAITPRIRDWGVAFAFAFVNWAADLGCFVLCCYAVGARGLTLGAAALAYVAGLATISITLTPGGLGSVEAGMLIGLAHGGVAAPVALAGVLAYRLIAYVLVGAVGWGAWFGIRRGVARRDPQEVDPQAVDAIDQSGLLPVTA